MTPRPVWKPPPAPAHAKTQEERFNNLLGRLLRVRKDELDEERERNEKRKTEKDDSA